jgi:hypothetical protein
MYDVALVLGHADSLCNYGIFIFMQLVNPGGWINTDCERMSIDLNLVL